MFSLRYLCCFSLCNLCRASPDEALKCLASLPPAEHSRGRSHRLGTFWLLSSAADSIPKGNFYFNKISPQEYGGPRNTRQSYLSLRTVRRCDRRDCLDCHWHSPG